jgi:uncharacterized membrane protein YqjE
MNEVGGPDSELSAGELVSRLSEQVSQLVRDELQLALVELKQKIKQASVGGGLIGAAGLVALLGLGALVAGAIAALARVLPVWAAGPIVGGALLVLAGLLARMGVDRLKQGTLPTPGEAMASIKQDIETVKEQIHHERAQ